MRAILAAVRMGGTGAQGSARPGPVALPGERLRRSWPGTSVLPADGPGPGGIGGPSRPGVGGGELVGVAGRG
jgi:hypothetical protein